MKQEIAELESYCRVVEHPGRKVAENLFLLQPALLIRAYSYVFLLLDDIKIVSNDSFQLNLLLRLMRCNRLSVVTPLILGANKGGGQKFRNVMQIAAKPPFAGHVSSFVEIFAWLMTLPAYKALWELLLPSVNPYAWGYDFWYDGYAASRVPGHRMGIASDLSLLHEQDGDGMGQGRTDNTKIEIKWNAVLAQERHFWNYKNISLSYYRKHLNLSNSSWNGAVLDYMYRC